MSGDSGLDGAAYEYFALALDAAREAGDDNLGARVVAATARRLADSRRAGDAAALLDRAGSCGGPGLTQRRCSRWARRGRWRCWVAPMACHVRWIRRSAWLRAGLPAARVFSGRPKWRGWRGRASRCWPGTATERGRVPTPTRGPGTLPWPWDSRAPVYVRSRALDLVGLAEVRLCQRELEEALAAGGLALEQACRLPSARTRRRVHRLAIRALEGFPGAGRPRRSRTGSGAGTGDLTGRLSRFCGLDWRARAWSGRCTAAG